MPKEVYSVDVVDIHIGGDVHRIVLDGVSELPGENVLEKARYLEKEADGFRKVLLDEPRGGHPALFADLIVKTNNPNADAGLIVMENNGYPMFSGTNIMSTAIALVENGRVPVGDGTSSLTLEASGGLVDVEVKCENRRVQNVTCQPSKPVFCYQRDLIVDVPGYGEITFDLYWAGEFFPVINPTEFGFNLEKGEEYELGALAKAFLDVAMHQFHPVHPEIDDVRPLAAVVFTKPLEMAADGEYERRVIPYVYPNRQVGRCSAGMPSSIVLAQLYFQGDWQAGKKLRTRSPSGTTLEVEIRDSKKSGNYDGVIIAVTGQGWTIAKTKVIIDKSDPMTPGDGFEKILNNLA